MAAAPAPACDVLVVGLGPVGALLATLLAQAGVDVQAIDRAPAPWPLPRAATVDDTALRILQGVGVAGGVVRDGVVLEGADLRLRDGRHVELLRAPARTGNGHPALVSLRQPDLEAALGAAAASAAGPRVHRGWELRALRQDAGAASAEVGPSAGGDGTSVRARWVVGCDGARSAVRTLTGIGFAGATFAEPWLVVDAQVPDAGAPRVTFAGDPHRPAVTLPLAAGMRRWEVMALAGEDHAHLAGAASVRRLVGRPDLEPLRAAVYTFHARRARRWRDGRVLVAGDAAHLMPPFAGQGLGAGLRDVANLAWKLAAVVRGAPENLLDTYERERAPHVARTTAYARFVGAIVQTRRPRIAAGRDAALCALDATPAVGEWLQGGALAPRERLGRGALTAGGAGAGETLPQPLVHDGAGRAVGLDDLLGPGWALVGADAAALRGAPDRPGLRALAARRDFDDPNGALRLWLGRRRARMALVRPDRVVFATAPGDAARLLARAPLA